MLVLDRQRKEGEKSFKCNQCDFESVQAGNSRTFKLTLEKKRTNAINATMHLHRQANWGHSNSLWRKAQKCKKCDFASVQAHNLRRELKKAYKYNQLQLSIYSGRRFERTSENSLRWKIVKMQSMLLCIYVQAGNLRTHSGEKEDNATNATLHLFGQTIWGDIWKSIQMQPMRLCICTGRQFEDTFEDSLWRKSGQMQPMPLCICSGR